MLARNWGWVILISSESAITTPPEIIHYGVTKSSQLAKLPWRVAVWLGKLAIGDGGVSMMTKIRGGSNAKAKRELEWQPIYPSWRRGFAEGLN